MGLRIGILEKCERSLRRSVLREDSSEFYNLKKEVLLSLDFMVCSTVPTEPMSKSNGHIAAFNTLQSRMISQRFEIQSIDRNIQVMWYTYRMITDNTIESGEKQNEVCDYYIHVDKFANYHNYAGWVFPAIGITIEGHMGWWRLTNQHLINDVAGYAECTSLNHASSARTDILTNETTSTTLKLNESGLNEATEATLKNQNETYLDGETSRASTTEIPSDTDGKEDAKEHNLALWKIVAIIFGTLFTLTLSLGTFYIVRRKRKPSRMPILTKQEIHEFRHGVSSNDYNGTIDERFVNATAFKLPYDRLLELPRDKLEMYSNQTLGDGEYGRVCKGLVEDEAGNKKEVALKTVKPNSGVTVIKGFLSEIKILSYLGHHPNIVPILGAYTAELYKGIVYIATELCPLGSLKTCLINFRNNTTGSDSPSLAVYDMIRWSNEIACGIEYLGKKGVIHADLATRNVLLSAENTARITDFGLARRLYEYTNYTKTSQEPLPWRWMACESLKIMEFSPKSDVWSYGVTLWEIFSLGAQPYPGIGWTVDFVESLESGLRLKQPKYASPEIFEIIDKCWILDPEARPNFTELKISIRQIQTNGIIQAGSLQAEHFFQ